MSITLFSQSDASEDLLKNQHPILFSDTCALLDVVRLPIRVEKPSNLKSYFDSILIVHNKIIQGEIRLVVPPLVRDEWQEHVQKIRGDVSRHFKRLEQQYENMNIIATNQETAFPEIKIPGQQLVDHLKNLSESMLNNCIELMKDDSPSLRANERAVANTAPAKRGGGIQDCMIYEHVLEVMAYLHKQGFAGPKVFLTSNTQDFCADNSSQPKPPIDAELKSVNAVLCTNWMWALNELKSA